MTRDSLEWVLYGGVLRERESLGDCKGWYSGSESIVSGKLERRDGLKGGKVKGIGSELRLYIV